MGNINGGNNPYENLTKSSFQNAVIISNESQTNIDLSDPIYRVVTWKYVDNSGVEKRFQRVLDTRYLFKPSEFWNINKQLGLEENIFIDDVMYSKEVTQQEYLLDQSIQNKLKVASILNLENNTIH